MDASASKGRDAEVDKLFGLYLIENSSYSPRLKQKKSVIKYTRLPDAINSKASWPPQAHTLEPRLRRIITIEEPKIDTRRSLKSDVAIPSRVMASDICKRKIVTIEEDDEFGLYPKFSQQIRKTYTKVISKAIEPNVNHEKPTSEQKRSRITYSSKNSKGVNSGVKNNTAEGKREMSSPKLENKYKYSRGDNEIQNYAKNKSANETLCSAKNVIPPHKLSLSEKTPSKGSDKEIFVSKGKLKDERLTKLPPGRTPVEQTRTSRSPINVIQTKTSIFKEMKEKHKPITVIHVPLDEKLPRLDAATEVAENILNSEHTGHTVDCCIQVMDNTKFKDKNIGTEVLPNKVDQGTEVDQDIIKSDYDDNDKKINFDSLDIPNVSLTNNSKSDLPKEDIVNFNHKDLPILDIPINFVTQNDEKKYRESRFHKSTSYIISRATLTYTTKQKINFQVVKNHEILQASVPSSPFNYPINVVSVYKQEMKNHGYHDDRRKLGYGREDENDQSHAELVHSDVSTSVNCSYVSDNDKLVKPSDIISTIKVNNSLLHGDYICEQFQRELNFIDSFFESLQYLENCSLSEKCIAEKNVENWINNSGGELKSLEFGSFLSNFENEINIDDSKTMASKSLCLLNLLIRDEQRRAKNLLFVLKMREDALKDFTKSQILWLENKKKQDNTDISTLKKKQRGALLKLQHECGEMQRMRKALLTLSEKRKLALMKTKKNIEIKLRNSVDVEQIILDKKKLKRSPSNDRNVAPLKCFELSSSGCDDSTTSRPRSNTSVLMSSIPKGITCVEKCVQTGENSTETITRRIDRSVDIGDENYVVVDGGYLNILFHNLSLPQIFSSEKQYEVNKEALYNIVHTSNIHNFNWNNDLVIGELMQQIKNHDLDGPNTPSTARSLVEEFDKIYKGLGEDMSNDDDGSECARNSADIDEVKSAMVKIDAIIDDNHSSQKSWSQDSEDGVLNKSSNNSSIDEACTCEPLMVSVGTQSTRGKDSITINVSGPLPVPAGAAAVADDVAPDVSAWITQKSSMVSSLVDSSTSSSQVLCPSVTSLTSPVQYEAEELRRQQLAIEREIKALEQQQSQLLAVREIPDKPPPPYTPPSETLAATSKVKFGIEDTVEEKIRNFVYAPSNHGNELTYDPFDVFLEDFARDSVQKQKLENSGKYWDTCNFPPSKPELSTGKLIAKTTSDLKEVLTSVPPTIVSGVGARRSDHIDDILFAEWRRCEPEWTSLHADEVIVKNQVFESIFQRILTETIDEYKRSVPVPKKKFT